MADSEQSLVLGLDGGTEGLRAGLFTLGGEPLAFASVAYATQFPQPAWAEQDPADWWAAAGEATRRALAEAGVSADAVLGMAVDTTCCSVVMLDANGDAVRPALIWMDVRSGEHAQAIADTGDPALRVNSDGAGPVSAEWLLPKARWLKHNDRARYDSAHTVCEYQDYLNWKLTGRRAASLNNASVRWHYDARRGGYADSLLAAAGLEDLKEKLPDDVVPMGAPLGLLTKAAAEHLGLSPGLPVAQGGADAFVAMPGLGVVDAGKFALITGSSHLQLGLSAAEVRGAGVWGSYADAVIPGLHTVEGGQTSTGSIINWLRGLYGDDASYDALNAAAEALPPGSDGVVVLDHFQGNRTPYTDPDSRGVISGLSLSHGREHLFRAAIEGIAFGTELIFANLREHGVSLDEIVVCGGATRSPLWLQVHADVSNVPLRLTAVADAPALGSAVLAATGAGAFDDVASASRAMVRFTETIEPDAARHDAYREVYEVYRDTYGAVRSLSHRQAALAARARATDSH